MLSHFHQHSHAGGHRSKALEHLQPTFNNARRTSDNGPDALCLASNERLYDRAGLSRIRRALTPGGLLAVWSAESSPAFESRLADAVDVWKKAAGLDPDSSEIAGYIKRTESEIATLEELSYESR